MKKIILLALAALMMVGCEEKELKEITRHAAESFIIDDEWLDVNNNNKQKVIKIIETLPENSEVWNVDFHIL